MKRESKGFSRVEIALFPTMLVSEQLSHGEGPTSPVGTQHTPTVIKTSLQLQNISNTYRKTKTRSRRMGIRIPQSDVPSSVTNEAITKKMHNGLARATTTASSLEAEQGSGEISKTQTKVTPSGPSSLRTSLEGVPEKNELKSTKVVYNKALITLTKRVKKLEKKLKHKRRRAVVDSSEDEEASLDKEDSLKHGRMIEEINEDENVNLVKSSKQGEAHETAGPRIESDDTEVVDISTASPQKDDDEITIVETLVNIKKSATKDKGKAIMQESEPPKKIKKKEMIQISLDEKITQRFMRKSKHRDHRQKKEDVSCKRAEEKRNKPSTQAQQRTYMSNYIKNIGEYTLKQLKQYSFEEIKMLFDRTMESIRKFVLMESEGQIVDSKAGEGSSKEGKSIKRPAEEELGQEQQKKQKVKKDLSQERLQQMVVIIPEQGIHVEALQSKYPIIKWEIYTKGTR
nr:hypothetical protein [Tanacetum cinerariifolium]